MKTGRFTQTDSTGLLLDTVCNVFGGIILIALLVALLAREAESKIKLDVNPDARMELLDRRETRIAAENNRVRVKNEEIKKQLAALTDPEIGEFVDAVEAAKQELARIRDSLADRRRELEISTLSEEDLLESLEQDRAKVDAELAREESRSLRLEAQLSQLKQQEQELIVQRKAAKKKQTVRLRLPKERTTGKRQVWVLVRHGRLYPTYLRRRGVPLKNNTSIKWTEILSSHKAVPIPGKGLNVIENSDGWKSYLRQLNPRSEFVAFAVWPDSYKAFNMAKIAAVSLGMSYGWDIEESGEEISFSSSGTVPKPQ